MRLMLNVMFVDLKNNFLIENIERILTDRVTTRVHQDVLRKRKERPLWIIMVSIIQIKV